MVISDPLAVGTNDSLSDGATTSYCVTRSNITHAVKDCDDIGLVLQSIHQDEIRGLSKY